jgi:glyoxylate utilization-related uncharacterized protein
VYVLGRGQPACPYHAEGAEEAFLVLRGEALLLVEGEQRPLRQWDFAYCPRWTEHVIVGWGESRCIWLAVGARPPGGFRFPVSTVAARYGASVSAETTSFDDAFAGRQRRVPTAYREGWLPSDA